jgi:hypothetical protein
MGTLARIRPLRIIAVIALGLSAGVFFISGGSSGLLFAIPIGLMAWGMWLDKAIAWWLSAIGGVLLFVGVYVSTGMTSDGGNDAATVVVFAVAAAQVLLPLARLAWTADWGMRILLAIAVVLVALMLASPVVDLLQNGGWAN